MTQDWFLHAQERRHYFLSSVLNGDFAQEAITPDMAPRHYYRVTNNHKTFILLESAPDGHQQALPGHELKPFIKNAQFLKEEGFRTPDIYEASELQGLVLLEDFGDVTFESALSDAGNENLYLKATELLCDLRGIGSNKLFELPTFSGSRIDQGARRFVDWFLPYYYGRSVTDEEIEAFEDVMLNIKSDLPAIESGFVHGDFHPANLMVLKNGDLGLLDFQAAMRGPSVYDLTNLLHDARRRVDTRIIMACQSLYFKHEENDAKYWYNYLSLHFHARVIGQFIKVAMTTGKTGYLQHIDRLWSYLSHNQNASFQKYCAAAGIDFSKDLPKLDLENIKKHIRPDAT